VAVEQIEFASTVLLVNWAPLSTPDLSTVMALVSHLSPHARLRLDRGEEGGAERPGEHPGEPVAYSVGQERPGWVGILNEDFDPHITDPRVAFFRYEQLRPMHPGRLSRLLDGDFSRGAFGTVLRSAGFCRLASRPRVTAKWEHVGQMFSMHPLIADDEYEDDDEVLGFGQDIAGIGLDLDRPALVAALDEAALTDEEFAAGPAAWAGFADPFPVSRTSAR
jgi:G3E family GTPase